jgi:zinc transport system substrate-binding protein
MHRAWGMKAFVLLVAVATLAACGGERTNEQSEPGRTPGQGKPVVYVVNYPLQYFAERIGGDHIHVVFPAPPDEDPAYWTPGSETVTEYQQADLIILNGAGYARWVEQATLPQSRLVDTSASFRDDLAPMEGAGTHSHGPTGEHEHTGWAFTTWLDPGLAVEQAEAVRDALVARWPDRQEAFGLNFGALRRELLELDRRVTELASREPGKPLLASHPVYQYMARRYGLDVKSVHWEADESPDDRMWQELADLLESHPARWMIWEGVPAPETAGKLQRMGVGSVVFSPCGNAPDTGNYLSVMRANAGNLEAVFPQ